jgi:hypothetical protein
VLNIILLKVKRHVLKTFFTHNLHVYFAGYLQNFITSYRYTYEYIHVAVILILVICSWEACVTHFVHCWSVQYKIMLIWHSSSFVEQVGSLLCYQTAQLRVVYPHVFRTFKKCLNTRYTVICMCAYIYLCTYITYLHLGILRGVISSGSRATLGMYFLTLLH